VLSVACYTTEMQASTDTRSRGVIDGRSVAAGVIALGPLAAIAISPSIPQLSGLAIGPWLGAALMIATPSMAAWLALRVRSESTVIAIVALAPAFVVAIAFRGQYLLPIQMLIPLEIALAIILGSWAAMSQMRTPGAAALVRGVVLAGVTMFLVMLPSQIPIIGMGLYGT
jgi:hypothetical protein